MSKEELIHAIHKEKCDMLEGLPLESMKKEDIIIHLENSCCEVLNRLLPHTKHYPL
jgi:hypothetical protein